MRSDANWFKINACASSYSEPPKGQDASSGGIEAQTPPVLGHPFTYRSIENE